MSRRSISARSALAVFALAVVFTSPLSAAGNPEASQVNQLTVAFQPIVQTDPALISSDSEVFVANAVFDYLVDIDARSNPVPRLATSWSISDDGLNYTFNLASGVRFHDVQSLLQYRRHKGRRFLHGGVHSQLPESLLPLRS